MFKRNCAALHELGGGELNVAITTVYYRHKTNRGWRYSALRVGRRPEAPQNGCRIFAIFEIKNEISGRIVLARRVSLARHGRFVPLRSSPDWRLTMPSTEKLDTHHKPLTLNLDTSTFGSFAEIGAGQEVARSFLLVGVASPTVAKTISAYDKEVSDDLYGSGSRYVSKQRLRAMLDNEWTQLLPHLRKTH